MPPTVITTWMPYLKKMALSSPAVGAEYGQDPVGGRNSYQYIVMPTGQTGRQVIAAIRSMQYETVDSPLLWFLCEISLTSLNTLSLGSGAL